MSHRCPLCGATEARLRYRLSHSSILTCAGCEHIYLWPMPTEEEIRAMFAQLYTTGDGSVAELRSYYGFCYEDYPANPLVQLYEKWLDALERHHAPGRILDVGCGTGLFLAVARRRGWTPFGIDDCAEATRHAREHFKLDVRTGEFAEFAAAGDVAFDAITMWDIIEHSRAPVDLLATVRRSLGADGIVGVSVPNQRSILDLVCGALYRATGGRVSSPLERFYVTQHFSYFTPETLERALDMGGLSTVHIERELTDLRRLTLAPPVRLAVRALFQVAKWTGLENRLFAVARVGGERAAG
jgi:SAM-dependent methyltransferase